MHAPDADSESGADSDDADEGDGDNIPEGDRQTVLSLPVAGPVIQVCVTRLGALLVFYMWR
jgi:hypothetical protein